MKRLIVTADDFGMSPGINRGIVQAHRGGIVTSASLLVNRPASKQAAVLGRDCPALSVGLHLEMDSGQPERAGVELEAQLARFLDLVGTAPTHVDSHHNVHNDARVLPHVLVWAERHGVPVRGHSRARHVGQFYGQWGGDRHVEQISFEGLLRLVDTDVCDGITELSCHPGYVEPGFPSSYTVEREVELRTLCDQRVRREIEARQIRLVGFRDLCALATPASIP